MKRATIADIGKIMTILQDSYGDFEMEGVAYNISMKMKFGTYFYFLNDDDTALMVWEHIGSKKAQFHVYSLPESRGKGLIDFCKECGDFVLENSELLSFITFIPEDNKPGRMLARLMGLHKKGTIEDASDSGVAEYLFAITREQWMMKKKRGVSSCG